MYVELKPELEHRLVTVARERSQSVSDLVEEAMLCYLSALESDASSWVATTQGLLPRVWPKEDFTEWVPLDGR